MVPHLLSSNLGWGEIKYMDYITTYTYLSFPWCPNTVTIPK
jgi:hypothetical protein